MGEPAESRGYPAHWEADVVLRDGAAAHLRPISTDDAERLQRMHAAQSESSIYLRYFTYKSTLTPKELRRFTQVDHVDRVAMVVLLASPSGEQEIIGLGGYDRIDGSAEAEVSFNISDAHQGRGLGSILLEHLAAAGRERGLRRFSAEVLPQNRKMLTVFSEAGYEVQRRFEDGVVLLEFSIDPTERSRAVMEAREHRAESRSVAELLAPKQVAVIGASREYGSVGYHLLQNLVEGRFTGGVHSVNPEAFEVGGTEAYASLAHIKQDVDLAVVAVPPERLAEVVIDCGRHGVKGLLVVTSGLDRTEGLGLDQRELVRLARQWGMRVIGPASVGLINTAPDVALNASLSPQMPLRGGVGLFSQSASIGVSLYAAAHRRQIGLSAVISAGNRADLSGNDAMQRLEDDEATRAVGISLESFGNPRKFSRIARRLSLTKPVVVATSDVTGRRLPPGHDVRTTSAPQGALDAMLENSGVIRCGNHDSLMDVLQVLATQPLPAGGRVGTLSNSPSMSRVLADAAEAHGLEAAHLDGSLDLEGTQREAAAALAEALDTMLGAEEVDAVAVCLQPSITGEHHDHSRTILETAQQHPKPVVVSLIGILEPDVPLNHVAAAAPVLATGSLQQGVPVFSSPARSMAALGKIVTYQRWRRQGIGEYRVPPDLEGTQAQRAGDELLERWLGESVDGADLCRLDPGRTDQLLEVYGLEAMESAPFDTEDEAVEAAERLGWPVAVKATSSHLRHRLDLGGVRLNISDATMLRRTVAEMRHQLAHYGAPGLEIQTMAPIGQGCMVRAIEDPLMGPVVSFGISGDAVDLLDDWAHAVPPLTDQDIRQLVRGPRAARKLLGHRGLPVVDIAAVEEVVQRVALLKDNHPQVASLELAPLLAAQEGVRILHAAVDIANPEQRTDSARRAISRW
ncbi:GNAT family N-acetyltransferase [Nesterenkonia sp. HG001]|uniref:GNAT family N-acetyltransferase n=1 Tax=Nesterenkonia sp. HG001 TaxID=2983207 RepID=UPI002AC3AB5C|nr:GNAT family N-acetyltransferase [Nesterenkonia sp. HG001]MDZ5078365.1 GNAT family N-acetyltransferase [Nesterenkonia sp. HG001]